jgi:hypothetical protein
MLKTPRIMAKAPRIKKNAGTTAYNGESTAVFRRKHSRIMRKAPNKMRFDHFKPAMAQPRSQRKSLGTRLAMAFNKRRPKMKDDHIAYLPYA